MDTPMLLQKTEKEGAFHVLTSKLIVFNEQSLVCYKKRKKSGLLVYSLPPSWPSLSYGNENMYFFFTEWEKMFLKNLKLINLQINNF